MSQPPATGDPRHATVRHLAATGLSNRAIGRHIGIHHSTVARILRTTPAPAHEPANTTLTLPVSQQLATDIRLVAAAHKMPPEDITAALIAREAAAIRAKAHARFAATGAPLAVR